MYVHLLVCYLNKLQNAWYNGKDSSCKCLGVLDDEIFDRSVVTYCVVICNESHKK